MDKKSNKNQVNSSPDSSSQSSLDIDVPFLTSFEVKEEEFTKTPSSFVSSSSEADENTLLLLKPSPIPSYKSTPSSIASLVSECIPEGIIRATKDANEVIKVYFGFDELPKHLQDNFYILTGYRAHYSFLQCFKSIFAIHNETGNIWTHLIGAIVFILALFLGYQNLPVHATALDYTMVTIFLVSAIKCLLCSTIFHTFSCHTHSYVYDIVAILDYSGISLLILGSFVIYLNYALYCHSTLRWIYIAIVTFLCLSGVILPWFEFFRSNEFRVYRALFFIGKRQSITLGMGITAGLISIHSIFLNGWTRWSDLVPVEYLIVEIFLYLFGAYVYIIRVPEAWFPGKVDHWFHSHQVWHVMVFLAAYCHYIAVMRLLESRLLSDTCRL